MLKGVVSRNTSRLKGGYLDFSHLTESKNIYMTEIYIKKKKKKIIKNYES